MSNNIFYKALAAVSTVGIVVIAGIQVTTALKKGNNAEDQLAKTTVEIRNLRKEALAEVKSIRSEVLQEIKADQTQAISEIKSAKREALKNIVKSSEGTNSSTVWWLLAAGKYNQAAGSTAHRWSIPTNSKQECEFAGQKFLNGSFPYAIGPKARGYVCVKGK